MKAAHPRICLVCVALLCGVRASLVWADEPAAGPSATKVLKLPGIAIDLERGWVDLEGEICLDQGLLELVACTKGTKEHESIVAVAARPMHIHTALLLVGANSGNPAMRQPANEEGTRWIHLPPRGDAIEVFLLYEDAAGKWIERPIADLIARSEEPADGDDHRVAKFPSSFLFAGSHLRERDEGPKQYLADDSGNVISIVTFGDELLCLPGIQSHENGALDWQLVGAHLPKVGSKVTLRLRPRKK